jgi:hypothetical protein
MFFERAAAIQFRRECRAEPAPPLEHLAGRELFVVHNEERTRALLSALANRACRQDQPLAPVLSALESNVFAAPRWELIPPDKDFRNK